MTTKEYDNMVQEHGRALRAKYGEEVKCNFGWATDDTGICSKIYGVGEAFSTERKPDGTIVHWSEPLSA